MGNTAQTAQTGAAGIRSKRTGEEGGQDSDEERGIGSPRFLESCARSLASN